MKLVRNLCLALFLFATVAPVAQADVIGAAGCPKYERRVTYNTTFSSFQAIVNFAASHGADGFKSTTVYNAATCSYIYTLKYLIYCVNRPWYEQVMDHYLDHAFLDLGANGGVSDPIDITNNDSDIAIGLAVVDDTYQVIAIYADGSIASSRIEDVCVLFEGREDAELLANAAGDLLESANLK